MSDEPKIRPISILKPDGYLTDGAIGERKTKFELRIEYPNGSRGRKEFDDEAQAHERARELCEVHGCDVEVSKVERTYLYSLFESYDYAHDCWKEDRKPK